MKTSILSSLDSSPYFTIEAVKQLSGDETKAAGTVRTSLHRWMKSGDVVQLKRGVYMTRRFHELHRSDADFSLAISAVLIPQSYVSLEYILQRYGVLTETTYPVSAITVKNTRVFDNALGTFTYRHIRDDLYQGFSLSQYLGVQIAKASLAKALFDYLYLRPRRMLPTSNLAEDLRLNLLGFSTEEREEFETYVQASCVKKMAFILKDLRSTVWQH